jgi:hypothetical protein
MVIFLAQPYALSWRARSEAIHLQEKKKEVLYKNFSFFSGPTVVCFAPRSQ